MFDLGSCSDTQHMGLQDLLQNIDIVVAGKYYHTVIDSTLQDKVVNTRTLNSCVQQ